MEKQVSFAPNPLKPNATNVSINKGKLPPQAVELEEAILGAMMIDKKGLVEVIDTLQPEAFYKPEHQAIYAAIKSLFNESQPIDLLMVAHKLKQEGKLEAVGGDYYLIQLTQKVASSAHIEYHSKIVTEKYILRKLIEVSSDMIDKSYDDGTDVFELLDKAESNLFDITNGTIKKSYETAHNLVEDALELIKSKKDQEGMSGIPSGFKDVDAITSGWQNSDLIIIAARPGMGKTAFILSMALNIAIPHKTPIGIFSLEMSAVQLITRMISSETGISAEKLRKAALQGHEWSQLFAKVKNLQDAPIYIDDTPALSVFDLRAKCRRLVSQHGVKIIVIDYLQLMTAGLGKGGNREQEISTISRSLKAIAKELNVPVIALSQLSRAVESRAGAAKRPLLSDLRESGAIEQDADIVSFIYRPEYYKLEVWDDEAGSPCAGQAEFIIAKHRNGALDEVRLRFIGEQAKFMDLEAFDYPETMEFSSRMNASDSAYEKPLNPGTPEDAFGIPPTSSAPSYDDFPMEDEDDALDF